MGSRHHTTHQSLNRTTGTPYASILLAIGNRNVEMTLRRALQADGHTVVTLADREAVLSTLYAERIDLVILDAQSDRDASYALCSEIKSRVELGFVPIAILDETDAHWQDDSLAFQPDVVLLTPVDLRELHDAIRFLLRLKRQFNYLLPGAPAARAREIEVLRADIIRNVSHELTTPLLQIKSVIALLLDPASSAAHSATLDTMARMAAGRLEEIIDNIRQLAQAHDITLEPFVAHDALTGAVRYLERSWTWRGEVGRIQIDSRARDQVVLGDRAAAARLLQLLLENALKFSAGEAPVYLRAVPVDPQHVWFAVEDSGIGIAPEEQEQIFEVFYQVDRSPRRRYSGAGIGLALALLLADGMGTEIEVDSAPGEGSTFSFRLPLVDSGPPDPARHA